MVIHICGHLSLTEYPDTTKTVKSIHVVGHVSYVSIQLLG